MCPGMMGPGMMGHGDWAPWMMGPGGHHGMMMAPGMIQAFAEGKLAFLKSRLGITEAQSGPWNTFADAVRAQAKSIAESQQKRMPTPGQPEIDAAAVGRPAPTDDGRASCRDEEDQAGLGCPLPSADARAAAEGRSTHPHALMRLRVFARGS